MARITCVNGHDLPTPITGKTTCEECQRKERRSWETRSAAHRTCTDHPKNKGKLRVK